MHTERSNNEQQSSLRPDPETLHTTDPQKHMEGPVSSAMQETKKAFDTDETKDEADAEKERNM